MDGPRPDLDPMLMDPSRQMEPWRPLLHQVPSALPQMGLAPRIEAIALAELLRSILNMLKTRMKMDMWYVVVDFKAHFDEGSD